MTLISKPYAFSAKIQDCLPKQEVWTLRKKKPKPTFKKEDESLNLFPTPNKLLGFS